MITERIPRDPSRNPRSELPPPRNVQRWRWKKLPLIPCRTARRRTASARCRKSYPPLRNTCQPSAGAAAAMTLRHGRRRTTKLRTGLDRQRAITHVDRSNSINPRLADQALREFDSVRSDLL